LREHKIDDSNQKLKQNSFDDLAQDQMSVESPLDQYLDIGAQMVVESGENSDRSIIRDIGQREAQKIQLETRVAQRRTRKRNQLKTGVSQRMTKKMNQSETEAAQRKIHKEKREPNAAATAAKVSKTTTTAKVSKTATTAKASKASKAAAASKKYRKKIRDTNEQQQQQLIELEGINAALHKEKNDLTNKVLRIRSDLKSYVHKFNATELEMFYNFN